MALRKCACIDTLYTELDWLDRFQAAKNDGFEAVEFWDWRIRDLDDPRAAEKAGIAISGFNGDADYSLVDPTHKQKYLDYLKESIAAAKKVGAAALPSTPTRLGDGGIVVNHYGQPVPPPVSCARCTTRCSPALSWPRRKRSTSTLRR